MNDHDFAKLILDNCRQHVTDRTPIFYVKRGGRWCIGYRPRDRASARRHEWSRAERNRVRRFAHHVWWVRRLQFPIVAMRPDEPGTAWGPVSPPYLPVMAQAVKLQERKR